MLVGLLVFAVRGPVIGPIAPAFTHAVHGIAALFVTVGLHGLLQGEVEDVAQFEGMFGV